MTTDQMLSLAQLLTPEQVAELFTNICVDFGEPFQVLAIDAMPDGRRIVDVAIEGGQKKQYILTP
jgi:hypothetical protein